jgi:hypothetical protein
LRLIGPKQAYTLFGPPLPSSGTPSPIIYANAGRDLALGVAFLGLGVKGDEVGVRVLMIGTVVCIHFSYLAP